MSSEKTLQPLFILGPTGSGKSSIAIALAERLGQGGQACEIVSADAYQIYKDLPILTAAPSAADLGRVKHHLIHSIELEQAHDAAAHARMAERVITDIQSRGVQPIVVGGSGLYVKFISHGISDAPPSDAATRAQLEAQTTEELVEQFRELDPEGLANTAVSNKRYLVRNLEIVLLSGRKLGEWRQNWDNRAKGQGWEIRRSVEELDERIARRAQWMIENGLLGEVEKIADREISATAEKVLGLGLVREKLRGEIELVELEERLRIATRQYAKRQRTWLRRESWVRAVEIARGAVESEIVERIVGEIDVSEAAKAEGRA